MSANEATGAPSEENAPSLAIPATSPAPTNPTSAPTATPPPDLAQLKRDLTARCKSAGLSIEEVSTVEGETGLRVGFRCARETRWVRVLRDSSISALLAIPFENYVFLSGLEAVCSYAEGTIEVGLRQLDPTLGPASYTFRRLLGADDATEDFDLETAKISLAPTQPGFPAIEIGAASLVLNRLCRTPVRHRISMKLTGCSVTTHDEAMSLLQKAAGSVLYQLDLLADTPLTLERERRRFIRNRRARQPPNFAREVQYPKTQFDNAPLSLYWYGRSAAGMPLLQFLAFYQVIEFYFPIYSQSEAQRRLKVILKDPTFRGDKDTDIARLLSAIHVSRSGSFGDERSQLRSTLSECVDPEALRQFFETDEERKEFFLAKPKGSPYQKIPLANPTLDLRNDVAERVYDIRCKIVHTKTDSRDGNVELLLPFTPEAEQLSFDIELVQYLAQVVLVASSTPFDAHR